MIVHVCVCVCVAVMFVYCLETPKWIELVFGFWVTAWNSCFVADGGPNSSTEWENSLQRWVLDIENFCCMLLICNFIFKTDFCPQSAITAVAEIFYYDSLVLYRYLV